MVIKQEIANSINITAHCIFSKQIQVARTTTNPTIAIVHEIETFKNIQNDVALFYTSILTTFHCVVENI